MNRKQFAILIVLGIVAGGLGLLIARMNQNKYVDSGPDIGQKLLPDFPMNDVAAIEIREGTNTLHLVKGEDRWTVQERFGYAADFSNIGDLLRKLWDMKIVQRVAPVGAAQLPRLQLLEPGAGTNSATLLDLKDKSGNALATVLLGMKHMRQGASPGGFGGDTGWPDGRYVMVRSRPDEVAVVSDAFTEVEARADRWINKDFFKVEKLKAVSVTSTNAEKSWAVSRTEQSGPWTLQEATEGESLDTSKTSFLNSLLSYPSFVDVVDPATPESDTGMDQPVTAELETFDKFRYTVQVGKLATNDNYYLKVAVTADFPKERVAPEEETPEDKERLDQEFQEQTEKLETKLKQEQAYAAWTYLASKWTIDNLLKPRSDLLKAPEPPIEESGETISPPPLPVDDLEPLVPNPVALEPPDDGSNPE